MVSEAIDDVLGQLTVSFSRLVAFFCHFFFNLIMELESYLGMKWRKLQVTMNNPAPWRLARWTTHATMPPPSPPRIACAGKKVHSVT